jgi:simple sugar transport system substrate-binding protein
VKEGAIDLVAISDQVPAATKAKVEEVKKGLADGTFTIWKGPLKDQSGKEVLKAGEVGEIKMLLGINFYVKGVEGQLPASK